MFVSCNVYCTKKANLVVGNVLPLRLIPERAIVCSVEHHVGDRGVLARCSGDYAAIILTMTLPEFEEKRKRDKKLGEGRTEKPILKGGNAYHKFRVKRSCWPKLMILMEGGNHQHIGHPSTVSGDAPLGKKSGLFAARRTGLLRGQAAAGAAKADYA
ncbi:Ribosomal protein [Parasponia andersonii]|uniref:Ribosomal protein n=1 Tax=Parasponia andersonii TaxID=3476 RepID=A0A2P5ARS1_PARAD|nr:Ribosomal protein [Parasponia andersonii]